MATDISSRVAWRLKKAIDGKAKKQQSGTGRATFVGTDGNTAWVRIEGNDFDTPVKSISVDAQPGDSVSYDIRNGGVCVTGNVSSPSVNMHSVAIALNPIKAAINVVEHATDAARSIADAAKAVADATSQNFWTDDNGAHVTQVPQDEWDDPDSASYHSGPNALWNALGMLFRDGANNLLALIAGNDPGVAIYDGQGNADENIIASFVGNLIELGKNSTAAVIKLCGGKGIISYRVDSYNDEHTLSFASEDAYVEVESKHAYGNSSESSAHIGFSSDEYVASANIAAVGNTLGIDRIRRASVGVYSGRPMDSEDSSEYDSGSVVSLYGANIDVIDPVVNPHGSYFPMHNLIVALRSPIGTYTGSNSTATASASGWQLTWFNTVISEQGSPRTGDYTFSDGVLTATRDCVLEISGVMNWTDSIAGLRGFGIFYDEVGGSNEHSSFQYFSNDVSQRKSVVFPPRLFTLSEDDSLYFGRFQQKNAVYQNGTNFSWVIIKVVG